jgi:predicted SprT family Zn-dependent metalloprotease
MRIELINKTHWRDDHIRAFIARGMQAERPDLCKRGAPAMHVTVVYARRHRHSGYAYFHSRTIRIRLPKENPDKVTFAAIIAHELAHTRGLKHDMMNGCATYGLTGRWRELYSWAEALPLEIKPKTVKQRPQADAKLAHCNEMLRLAFTREKRAVTLRKKWQGKVRYYSQKLLKAAANVTE